MNTLATKDWHDETYKEEETPCPTCGEKSLVTHLEANGPDDYTTITECKSCGDVWTS